MAIPELILVNENEVAAILSEESRANGSSEFVFGIYVDTPTG